MKHLLIHLSIVILFHQTCIAEDKSLCQKGVLDELTFLIAGIQSDSSISSANKEDIYNILLTTSALKHSQCVK